MLLNVSIFAFYGAICPWYLFAHNDVIPIYRLIFLGILVMLLRRLPMVLVFRKQIWQIEDLRQASFAGFFGPIGVSAIFYLYTSLDFLQTIQIEGQQREDAATLAEVMNVVVWFMAICSIFVHGLTIPLGKLGFYLPRTVSRAISSERVSDSEGSAPFRIPEQVLRNEHAMEAGLSRQCSRSRGRGSTPGHSGTSHPLTVFKIGGTQMADSESVSRSRDHEDKPEQGAIESSRSGSQIPSPKLPTPRPTSVANRGSPALSTKRAIKFPDQNEATAEREHR